MLKLSVLCAGLAMAPLVQAEVIVMDFTASGFEAGAPQDPVAGRLTWEAASPMAPIDNLLSIDLTIAGYTYAMNEIDLNRWAFNSTEYTVGGLVSGIGSVDATSGAIADFFLSFDLAAPGGGGITYISTVGERRFWSSGNIDTRVSDDSPQPVPEPATLALLGLGVAGLLAARKTQRTTRGARHAAPDRIRRVGGVFPI